MVVRNAFVYACLSRSITSWQVHSLLSKLSWVSMSYFLCSPKFPRSLVRRSLNASPNATQLSAVSARSSMGFGVVLGLFHSLRRLQPLLRATRLKILVWRHPSFACANCSIYDVYDTRRSSFYETFLKACSSDSRYGTNQDSADKAAHKGCYQSE